MGTTKIQKRGPDTNQITGQMNFADLFNTGFGLTTDQPRRYKRANGWHHGRNYKRTDHRADNRVYTGYHERIYARYYQGRIFFTCYMEKCRLQQFLEISPRNPEIILMHQRQSKQGFFQEKPMKAMQRKFKMVTSQKKIGYKLIYPIQVME